MFGLATWVDNPFFSGDTWTGTLSRGLLWLLASFAPFAFAFASSCVLLFSALPVPFTLALAVAFVFALLFFCTLT